VTQVEQEGLVGSVYEPAASGPRPGVLVLHGSGGTSVAFTAALLAEHGFTAFALQYIGDDDALPDRIHRVPVSYVDRGACWFQSHAAVADGPLGIVGRSRGAEIGLHLAANYDWAGPVVSYVGSSVFWNTPSEEPAWVDADGETLPFVPGMGKPTLCEGQLDEATAQELREATTPVEQLDGPVCFIAGEADPVWPADRLAEMAVERLERADFDHEYDHRSYGDAGHFITPPYLPKAHHVFGGSPKAMARADADAWPAALDCLDAGLGR
jgi:dienelactone hydrolase